MRVADELNKTVDLTGMILTKMDGDARGGRRCRSARSPRADQVHRYGRRSSTPWSPTTPTASPSRILGMGDVLTLIEKAQQNFDQSQADVLQKKMRTGTFSLNDDLGQIQSCATWGRSNRSWT